MKIILFRHGEHKNDILTNSGKKNVKAMAQQLKEFNIKKIYVSSSKRCVQTANIIAKTLKIKDFIEKDELKERFHLKHLPKNEAEQLWWDNYLNLEYIEPKNKKVGETCGEFIKRNHKVFDEIVKSTPKDEDVLIVAHSATSYALINYFYPTPTLKWTKIGNANYLIFEI